MRFYEVGKFCSSPAGSVPALYRKSGRQKVWARCLQKGKSIVDKFIVRGGNRLTGEVTISGAKNAAVAIIPAVLIAESPCRIENVPNISDVRLSARILTEMGAQVRWIGKNTVEIDPTTIDTNIVPSELGRKMRGSYYNIGALLARYSHAIVPLPGGCDFGVRPIDQHIKGFKALGCTYSLNDGMIEVSAKELRGAHIYLDMVSVGATMNIILAAVKAKGLTTQPISSGQDKQPS